MLPYSIFIVASVFFKKNNILLSKFLLGTAIPHSITLTIKHLNT